MKRRRFLKSSAALAATASLGVPKIASAQAMPDVINVGHLVGICMSPLFYAHCELDRGARSPMPTGYAERAVYVVAGAVDVGGEIVGEGSMAVVRRDVAVELVALTRSIVMVLGGEPIGDRFIEWNFVSSLQENRSTRTDKAKNPFFMFVGFMLIK